MQDFTGVPAVVDLVSMHNELKELGGGVEKINPVDLVIDHSIMIDEFGNVRLVPTRCRLMACYLCAVLLVLLLIVKASARGYPAPWAWSVNGPSTPT